MHRFPHPLYVSFSSLAREKKNRFVSYSAKIWMSFRSLWISRWQPITVILSVSVSSTVLTQLSEDGELAWFNHPLTHSMMITHIARRQVDRCRIVTALSPITKWYINLPLQLLLQTETYCYKHIRLFFLWTSLSWPKNSYFKPYAAYMWSNDSQSVGKGAICILPM